MAGWAQMCRKSKGDRGLSCQPPTITLSLGKLSKCRGRKEVWGIEESCPAALKTLRCLKYPLSSADGFSCLFHRTLDQPREKMPLLVLSHAFWGLHLRRGLIPLLLPQVSCHPPSVLPARPSCSPQVTPCGRQPPPASSGSALMMRKLRLGWIQSKWALEAGIHSSHLPMGSEQGASLKPTQARAGPILYPLLQETEQLSEDGQRPAIITVREFYYHYIPRIPYR